MAKANADLSGAHTMVRDQTESAADFLARLGTNGAAWAAEFIKLDLVKNQDYAALTGWFANAIEAGRNAGWQSASSVGARVETEIPPMNRFTCGTAHVAAEAKLRIIMTLGITDGEAVQSIADMVDDINIDVALEIIRDLRSGQVPF